MTVRWFVTRDGGEVTHLVRVTETDSELFGEFFRDGEWHADGSVVDYLFDGSRGESISAAEGEAIEARLTASRPDEPANITQPPTDVDDAATAAIRAGFAEFFGFAGLSLPDPVPLVGVVDQHGWTVRFVLADGGAAGPRLDFLAFSAAAEPIHGDVDADGAVQCHDSLVEHIAFDAEIPGDEQAAERRVEAHNARVRRELARKRLI